jgi:hypothetical protein
MRLLIASALLSTTLISLLTADGTPPDQSPEQHFSTNTTGISVDVVVRDKHGAPVYGLTRTDFTVLEDSVAQEVTSFIAPKDMLPAPLGEPGAATAATSAGDSPHPANRPSPDASLIALVFGRLSGQGRVLANRAAEAATYFISILPGKAGEIHATLDLIRGGYTIGSTPLTLAARDALGRIQQAGTLPVGKLAPGTYLARVTLVQRSQHEVREAPFTVVSP